MDTDLDYWESLNKAEANTLLEKLKAKDPNACAAVINGLKDFLADNNRNNLESLEFFTREIDRASGVCISYVNQFLPGILAGRKQPSMVPTSGSENSIHQHWATAKNELF